MSTNDDVKWVTVDVAVSGDEPLLANPMSKDQLIAIGQKTTRPWPKDRDILEQADEKAKLMVDTEGRYGVPRQWLLAALKAGGRSVETGQAAKQKISTATSTRLRAFMRFDPVCLTVTAENERFLPFSHHTPYERDVKRGASTNSAAKASVAVPIVRPRWDVWGLKVRIQVSTSLSPDRIKQCFEIAGATCGLGDFRPGVGGEFGCFVVDSWVVYDDPTKVPEFELAPVVIDAETAASNGKVPITVGA